MINLQQKILRCWLSLKSNGPIQESTQGRSYCTYYFNVLGHPFTDFRFTSHLALTG